MLWIKVKQIGHMFAVKFSCDICSQSFNSVTELISHGQRVHGK